MILLLLRLNTDSKYNDKDSDDTMNGDNDTFEHNNHNNNNNIINSNNCNNERSNLGDVIVFDTSLLEEFSHNYKRQDSSEDSSIVDITNNCQQFNEQKTESFEKSNKSNCGQQLQQNDKSFDCTENYEFNNDINGRNGDNFERVLTSDRINVQIEDWKQENSQRDNVLLYLLKQEQHNQQNQSQPPFVDEDMNHHNSSYDAEDDEEDDEELERIRLAQEKSFRAKLKTFESLAKQEELNPVNINRTNSKSKVKDDSKRQPPAREDLIQSEQQLKERPVIGLYGVGYDSEDSEEVINARIQQLHIERQNAQRPTTNGQPSQPISQPQPLSPNVVYQSHNYNSNPPVVQSSQSQQRSQYEPQQYFMDESITKQNQTPVRSPQPIRPQPMVQTVHKQTAQLPYKQPIQPQEHLYVNQKQLFGNQNPNPNQYYEPIESHQRFVSF